jgi:hypothetical protein
MKRRATVISMDKKKRVDWVKKPSGTVVHPRRDPSIATMIGSPGRGRGDSSRVI